MLPGDSADSVARDPPTYEDERALMRLSITWCSQLLAQQALQRPMPAIWIWRAVQTTLRVELESARPSTSLKRRRNRAFSPVVHSKCLSRFLGGRCGQPRKGSVALRATARECLGSNTQLVKVLPRRPAGPPGTRKKPSRCMEYSQYSK